MANLRSKVAIGIAGRLPLRVCYWVLIRMGVRYVGGPSRPHEVVPDVPFTEALSRCHTELERRRGR